MANREQASQASSSFREMLDPTSGRIGQRLAKWWLTPKGEYHEHSHSSPFEKSMELFRVRQILKTIREDPVAVRGRELQRASGATDVLYSTSLRGLVSMAVYDTWKMEKFHLFGAATGVIGVIGGILTIGSGGMFALIPSTIFLAGNFYLALAQRYTRLRLERAINHRVQGPRQETLSPQDYYGNLNLRLPLRRGSN